MRLSPWSLIYQGRFAEALAACEQETQMLEASESNKNSLAIMMANALGKAGVVEERL